MSIYEIEQQAAAQYGVPYSLASDLFSAESGNDPNATNAGSGAMGLGQILPSTAAAPGYGISPLTNPYDPTANADFAMQYLAALFHQFGSWVQAVLHYYPHAATDPNYAATYAAAQQADAGTSTMIDSASLANQYIDPMTGVPGLATQAQVNAVPNAQSIFSNPTAAAGTLASQAGSAIFGGIWNTVSRAALVILGIGLILVAVMTLARRSDIATQSAAIGRGVRRAVTP